jgi:hypothetical protein
MVRLYSFFLLVFGFTSLWAQLPDTDIWLFDIKTKKFDILLTHPINITNRVGYDNQPTFSLDSKKIIYVSIKEDKQADIYFYDIKKKKNTLFTKTPISEYSPVSTSDKKFITSVVVEEDSSQRIHFINAKTGLHEKTMEADSVGYYMFLNNDTVVYYKLTEPHSLHYYVKSSKEDKWLGNTPIRAITLINRNTFIYGLKDSLRVTFYKYDFRLHKAERYCSYPSINEDAVWHKTLGLIKSEETKLLRFDEQKKEWIILFELKSFGIKKITRFNFDANNKHLVVVDNL